MKILLVSPYGGTPGGITRWTEHVISRYCKCSNQDLELDLVPMGRDKLININNSFLYRICTAILDYRKILGNYCNKLNHKRYDVVHLTSSASLSLFKDLFILYRAKRYGAKTIIHFHFGRIPQLETLHNWEWKLLCRVVNAADMVVVIDKQSYNTLLQNGFMNVRLLPNPIAPKVIDVIKKSRQEKRIDRTILFVGHGIKTKGIYELVDACRNIPNIKVKMLGAILDSEKDTLYKYSGNASWLNIQGEIPYEDVIAEMCKCDVFVLPTYTEGFPNVILESMACGCAIVTTPVGAIPEMLEEENDKHYGLMVEPRNVEQLKVGIEKMLSDADFKNKCRGNVQQRVIERYNIDSVWRQMVDIWNETIE